MPGRALLTVLSWVYGAAVVLRALLYRLRILRSKRLPVKIICFGNLTVGGAGKTSAVLLAAQYLRKKQYPIAILTRGYRRLKHSSRVRVLLDAQDVPSWEEVGDEPWMMHHALRGLNVPILVSSRRHRAGLEAVAHHNPKILLMDDGFQHLQLARDLDILLINVTNPFGDGGLLPRGNLREPLSAIRRAGLVILTHSDQVAPERLAEIHKRILAIHPKARILEAVHRTDFLFNLKTCEKVALEQLQGKPVVAFSAIGDPQSFENQLREIGADLVQTWRYADHHPYTPQDLRSIDNVRQGAVVVTTFKDLPRLPPQWQDMLTGAVLALAIRMEITKGQRTWETELRDNLNA